MQIQWYKEDKRIEDRKKIYQKVNIKKVRSTKRIEIIRIVIAKRKNIRKYQKRRKTNKNKTRKRQKGKIKKVTENSTKIKRTLMIQKK